MSSSSTPSAKRPPAQPGTTNRMGMKISYSATAKAPGSDLKHLERKALDLYNDGHYAEALIETHKVLDQKPDHIEALNFAGILCANLGDLEAAARFLNRVLEKNRKHFDAANNLGNILAQAGQLEQAMAAYQQALKIKPDSPEARQNLQNVRELRDTLDQRVQEARARIEEDPLAARPRMVLGLMLMEKREVVEALRAFTAAVRMDPDDVEIHNALLSYLADVVPTGYDKDIEAALELALDHPYTYAASLAAPTAQHLMHKHGLEAFLGDRPEPIDDALIAALDRSDLFLKFLRLVLNTNPGMELFLTRLRAALLDRVKNDPAGVSLDLAGALAEQAFLGEYVWQASEAELAAAEALAPAAREALTGGDRADQAAALVYAAYHPLADCREGDTGGAAAADAVGDAPAAGLPDAVARVARLTAEEPAAEQSLKPTFDTLADISDATSKEVRAQYEENPYPRWAQLPRRPAVDLAADMSRRFPEFEPPAFLEGRKEILVAGAGTGWHPLNIAMMYGDCQVLAIDLSTASLAYAKRQADKYGIGNIEFLQADILDLPKLGRTFDIVESIGVIHHMADPEEGWRLLVDRLRPGGLLKLGLYSEKARQIVLKAREKIAREQVPPTADGIRGFRAGLFGEGPGAGWDLLFEEPDFYSVSTCRDMLFHVQEHRFTIPRIEAAVKANGLKFVGFEMANRSYIDLYRSKFPNDRAMRLLGNWAALERDYPSVILRYEFWCQKPPKPA